MFTQSEDEEQIVERLLARACIKLSVVASDIFGVSGRELMAALIAGGQDPRMLARMARSRMRKKIPALEEALVGHFDEHHRFLLDTMLARVDQIDADIVVVDEKIDGYLTPLADAADAGAVKTNTFLGARYRCPARCCVNESTRRLNRPINPTIPVL